MIDFQIVKKALDVQQKVIHLLVSIMARHDPVTKEFSVEFEKVDDLYKQALAEFDKPSERSQEIERAFGMLSAYGVPRERAKTLSNGIDVLATRYRKERNCFEMEKNEYAEAYHQRKCAECKK